MRKSLAIAILLLGMLAFFPGEAAAQGGRSIGNVAFEWPSWDTIRRVISLQDHNTRIVLLGVSLLGASGGLVGTFLLLRKRALLSDTISHSCLPGVALAFIVGEKLFGNGKSSAILLLGATLAAVAGVILVSWLRRSGRVKEDAALAMVLSVLFGLGISLVSLIQKLPSGNAAGLSGYIFGKAASMTIADATLISVMSSVLLVVVLLFKKELTLLCFDENYASTQGWPVRRLDFAMMGLVVAVTVIGLQAVGLLLVVALLIIPPASARFWCITLGGNLWVSALFGAASGVLGVILSALFPRLPAGAVIVLAGSAIFLVSLFLGSRRGLLMRVREQRRVQNHIEQEHLLRAIYEILESRGIVERGKAVRLPTGEIALSELLAKRVWTRRHLLRLAKRAESARLLALLEGDRLQLTREGWSEASRVTRNHRLWELYLIHYADTAAALVDHEADAVEHVVGREVADRLERLLGERAPRFDMPGSPHELKGGAI